MTAAVTPTTTYTWWCPDCHDFAGPFPNRDTAQQWADLHNHTHHTENTK
jgi:hypothetical protein